MRFQLNMYNPTDNEISLKVHNMHLHYNHTLYSFPLYTFCDLKMAHSGRNMSSSA